ncbi:hypothetical protein HN51_032027 [Arachis hypogaea]|uniref:Uncharacterized protein n=1 Tax=Arachis hypogaea TaxID=3818 RepID=A0A445B668_ARAHY|nr:hypothetical protein Ahy_A10g048890 [Arachis hypogaea]
MIMVASMTEILGEYTAVLTRVTERLLPRQQRSMSFSGGLRILRFASTTTSTSESSSFLLYF